MLELHLLTVESYNTKEILNFTSMNPKRQKFAGIWGRLPLKLTTAIGPLIRKGIP